MAFFSFLAVVGPSVGIRRTPDTPRNPVEQNDQAGPGCHEQTAVRGPDPPGDGVTLTPVAGEVPYLNRARPAARASGSARKLSTIIPMSCFSEMATAPVVQGFRRRAAGAAKLHDVLRPGEDTVDWPAEKLRQAIDGTDYDAWRQKAGRRVYRDRDCR